MLSQVSLVSKDSSMLDGLDNASIEMDEAKVCDVMVIYIVFFLPYRHCNIDDKLKVDLCSIIL